MRKTESHRGIERKILTSILWVGILPMTLSLVVGYFSARQWQNASVRQSLSTVAEKTTEGLRLSLRPQLIVLRRASRDKEISRFLESGSLKNSVALENLGEALTRSISGDVSESTSLSVCDINGKHLVSNNDVDAYDVPKNLLVAFMEAGAPTYSFSLKRVDANQQPQIRLLMPVLAQQSHEILGYVSETFPGDVLLGYALDAMPHDESMASGSDVYQILFKAEPPVVVSLDLDSSDARKALPLPLVSAAADERLIERLREPEKSDSGTLKLSNYHLTNEVFLAYSSLNASGVYVIVYRPASIVFRNINMYSSGVLLLSFLIITVVFINAYRNVHNNIVRPVSLLNEGAQIVRQGDLELKLVIGTGDEIEELASSFNKMALALKHNINQLAESEENYRSLVTSMRDGLYKTEPDGTISFMNPAGVSIFGYDKVEDVIGQNLRELFLDEMDYARLSSELYSHGFVERSRVWMKQKDGRTICAEISGNRVHDSEGAAIGAEGTFCDVTASVRLEQEARERSERISAINKIANVINSSLEAGRLYESLVVEVKKLVNFDYAGLALLDDLGERFEAKQLWAERTQGWKQPSTLDGEHSCSAWVARERKCLIVDDLAKDKRQFQENFPKQTRSCLCVPLYASGRITGTLNLGAFSTNAFSKHDTEVLDQMAPHIAVAIRNTQLLDNLQLSLEEVTQAREKLHAANEELKSLDEMKTNLLSNVSHELRTPLVAVMGYTDMILNSKAGPINEVQEEYLGISLRNIEKLVTLIENLLDFSRLHRGAEELVFDTFDLSDCARSSLQIIQPVSDNRKIKLDLITPEERVLVEGDSGKLGQVFNNLLSNAVKFNENGGSVTVEIRHVGASVEVIVSDTGIGIPEEALEKVFTRFYQYDGSSTRKYGGTGIGLSIAMDIVRLHGGRITVTSEFGEGATFRFSLPTLTQEHEQGDQSKAQILPLPTETSLLIELVTQDRALSSQIRNTLVPEGMEIIHAIDDRHAISLATKHSPDCILLDSDVRGQETGQVESLLEEPMIKKLPIVLLTNDNKLFEGCKAIRENSSNGAGLVSQVKRNFRKSELLSGIQYAVGQDVAVGEPRGNRILCVDDDPEVLVFMSRCLENEGYVVESCKSGETALEKLRDSEYGIVMLDIAMPGMDGWEVCRRIKADPEMARIKVYMVTAKPRLEDGTRPRDARPDGSLIKPFKPEDLIALVHRARPPSPVTKE